MRKRSMMMVTAALVSVLMVSTAATADTTIRVDENPEAGWVFNPDANNATPFQFTTAEQSIGTGSLEVLPIAAVPGARKFIAALPLGVAVSDLTSIAYDFKIGGLTGNANDAKDFYLNVYANIDNSDNFYDCRFDYLPANNGSMDFRTVTFAADHNAPAAKRGARFVGPCPANLAGMPEGSHVRAMVLNVGDTGTSDAGLGGFLDNVVVTTASAGATTYDLEARPGDKDGCKGAGWVDYGFLSQGECVGHLQANAHAGK